jgi:hypothetical protein
MERLEGLGKYKKFNDLMGTRNRDLSACRTEPQASTLPRALHYPLENNANLNASS